MRTIGRHFVALCSAIASIALTLWILWDGSLDVIDGLCAGWIGALAYGLVTDLTED